MDKSMWLELASVVRHASTFYWACGRDVIRFPKRRLTQVGTDYVTGPTVSYLLVQRHSNPAIPRRPVGRAYQSFVAV